MTKTSPGSAAPRTIVAVRITVVETVTTRRLLSIRQTHKSNDVAVAAREETRARDRARHVVPRAARPPVTTTHLIIYKLLPV